MINPKDKFMENFLQKQRFKKVERFLNGDILDFGGNRGELGEYFRNKIKGKYLVANYDHSIIKGEFDMIVSLAVIEHMKTQEVFKIIKKLAKNHLRNRGTVFLTTPTKLAKPVLEIWSRLGIVEKENIEEHEHYWTKSELYELAHKSGLIVEKYKKFQVGMNQYIIMRKIGGHLSNSK